ncbi:MAG TPA: hypothetical protein VJV05_16215 [Pyrinomonadaceae bacterium]|nr:hypothetical protein [Pyrinomonadaceae bacterium]
MKALENPRENRISRELAGSRSAGFGHIEMFMVQADRIEEAYPPTTDRAYQRGGFAAKPFTKKNDGPDTVVF